MFMRFLDKYEKEATSLLTKHIRVIDTESGIRAGLSIEDRVLWTVARSHITVLLSSVIFYIREGSTRGPIQEVRLMTQEQLDLFNNLHPHISELLPKSEAIYTRVKRISDDIKANNMKGTHNVHKTKASGSGKVNV